MPSPYYKKDIESVNHVDDEESYRKLMHFCEVTGYTLTKEQKNTIKDVIELYETRVA